MLEVSLYGILSIVAGPYLIYLGSGGEVEMEFSPISIFMLYIYGCFIDHIFFFYPYKTLEAKIILNILIIKKNMSSATSLWVGWVKQKGIPPGTNAWKTYENTIFLTEEQCERRMLEWNQQYSTNSAWVDYLNTHCEPPD